MRELALSQEIAERGRELESAGLLWLTAGNISARAGPAIVVTPPGIPYAAVEAADVVLCSLEDGEVLVRTHSECRVEDRCRTYGEPLAEPAA